MKAKLFLAHFVWVSLVLLVGISCGNDIDPDPNPPLPPIPPHPKGVFIRLTATSESIWNKDDQLMVVAYNKEGQITTRTSVIVPRYILIIKDGINTRQAVFEGKIPQSSDSLMLYRINQRLMSINFTDIFYRTDSLFAASEYGEFVAGSCKVDTTKAMLATLNYRSSLLDVKLTNKTGTDLSILKVIMQPADPAIRPFYHGVDEISAYSFSMDSEYQRGNNETMVTYTEGLVRADSLFTTRIPLLLSDEAVMDGKAITYSVVTKQGIYRYTKIGKIYESSKQYEEQLVLEGQ